VKQMSDWLDVNLPVVTKTHGEMMRGALPPALIQLKAEADTDLSDYQAVAVDTTSAKTEMDCRRHNKAVRDATAKKAAAGETLLSSIRNLKNGVAQDLIEALSPRAPLRLKAMLDAHKDAHVAQCYDGVAMFKELIALKNTTGLVEESIDHDIAVEEMRDTQLPDGYAVDATSKAAEAELKQLNDAFKLTLKPAAFFLGNNVTVHDGAQGGAP